MIFALVEFALSNLALISFGLTFLYRYVRLIVCTVFFTLSRSIVPLDVEKRRIGPGNTTVVIPSVDGNSTEIRSAIRTILDNHPAQIIFVTIDKNHAKALQLASVLDEKRIKVLSCPRANKREQMMKGLEHVETDVTVLADDDVWWKPRTLDWLLAPFDDQNIGATGTSQRLRRAENPTEQERIWNYLAASYLERRNFDCISCNAIDGGLPCLSGRTSAYRTEILTDKAFQAGFANEMWRGTHLNHADDDNFLTRWVTTSGYKIKMQYSDECEVETTLASDSVFLAQCLRWSRSNWRSNSTTLGQMNVWRKHPWSIYAVFQTTLTAWALPMDILLVYLLRNAVAPYTADTQRLAYVLYFAWWLAARIVKCIGHYRRYPCDILLLPVSILFGYYHCLFIKTHALATIHQTRWGSRADADLDDECRMVPAPRPFTYALSSSSTDTLDQLELRHPPRAHRSFDPPPDTTHLLD